MAQALAHGVAWRTLLVHLRVPFQLLLAPVFLWGWLLAGGGLAPAVLLAFVSFHLFLYGGATAFNSYYDRDVGPVGGLKRPPPVAEALLPFSLAVKAAGWLLAALVNLPFFLIYGGFAALSLAYSHPRLRWKARPWPSLLTVAIGQGVLAFLGAWTAVRGDLSSAWTALGLAGALAATLLLLGFYPLTQLYQIEEDRARGDRTIAVAWGPRACFVLSLACQTVGGVVLLAVMYALYGWTDALAIGLALVAQVVVVARWAMTFDARQVLANYRRVMRLNSLCAGGLGLYLLGRIVQQSLLGAA